MCIRDSYTACLTAPETAEALLDLGQVGAVSYTHLKNVRADLTVEGDLRKSLSRLAAGISRKEKGWLEEIRSWIVPAIKDPGACKDNLPQPRQVIETVARLTEDPLVVTDVGQHQMLSLIHISPLPGVLTPGKIFPHYNPK